MEKRYRVTGGTGHWAISEDDTPLSGDYATREGGSRLSMDPNRRGGLRNSQQDDPRHNQR